MTAIVLSIFCVLLFPHKGNFVTIIQIDYCMSSTKHSTMGDSVPLVGNHPSQYHSIGMGSFKISSLMGVFPQLSLVDIPSYSYKSPMHMISFDTYGPHRPPDPWVVSHNLMEDDEAHESPLPPLVGDIASLAVPLVPPDVG